MRITLLVRSLLVLLALLVVMPVTADTLPQKIERFRDLFTESKSAATYDIRLIQGDFPTSLLTPESMLPQTSNYPFKYIKQLYQAAKICKGPWPVSPLVTDPLVFTRAMCNATKLPTKWFIRSGMIHPGGGTYAARYIEEFPAREQELLPYMHIKERPLADSNSMLGRLQRMKYDAVSALIAGADTFVSADELWLRNGNNYDVYNAILWKAKLEESDLSFSLSSLTTHCYVRTGNVCWDVKSDSKVIYYSILGLVIANISLICAWSFTRWNSRRRDLKDRMLVLQILTHELRTPIASLSLTVEGFRREFDRLPESVYDEFRRLCEDSRRLRQLAEASKDYLQSEHQHLAAEWIPSVNDWFSFRYEESDTDVNFSLNHDSAVKVNIYWLGNCIDNLVNNACKYGVGTVELNVTICEKKIKICVKDDGNLSAKDWNRLRKPFVSQSGLGLGLTIVDSMVKRMGGTLKLQGPPTSFILEVPCETNTTIS